MRKILSFVAAMLIAFAANAQTDFAAPGYSCAADDAVLTGGSSDKFYLDQTATPHHIAWNDVGLSSNALATWTVTASRGCYVRVSLDLGPVIASNKHNFEVKILDANSNVRGTVGEGGENTASEQVKLLADSILLPVAGTYTVELRNNRDWGKGSIKNVILTYTADAPSEIIEVTSVVLNKTELALEVEEVEMLTATVLPENATDPTVTWTSSDPTVATVSEDGLVTAIAVGTANITATAGKKSAVCAVTVAATSIPNVDFIEPYVLSGKKAHLEGAIWKMYKEETYKLYGDGGSNKNYGTASWTIHVTKPCKVTGLLNGVEGGHEFVLDVFSGELLLGTSAQQEGTTWWTGNIPLTDTITFAAAGDYTLKLRNTQEWSSGKVAGVTLTITPGNPKAIYLTPAIWAVDNAKFGVYAFQNGQAEYFSEIMTLVEGETAIYETTIPENYHNVVFLRLNNGATEVAWANMWNQTIDLAIPEGKDMYTIEAWGEGEGAKSYGTWSKFEPTPAPEPATPVYSYVHTKYSSNNSYAEAYNITVNEMEWSIMANLATDAATRFGGKSLTAVDKPMYTKQPMAAAIDSIVIRHLGCTSDKLKVNSIKVEVASDAAFATLLDTITVTPTIGKNDTNTVKIALTNAVVNSYYRITYNLTNSQNSNYAFQITQIDFYGTATPEPQGCDWDKIAFLGDGSPEQAYSNQFKVCVGDPAPKEIVNIQKPGFAAETGIYMTFESAAFGTISLPEGKYVKDGAGVVFYLSAFTAKETEVTVQNNNAIIEFTVYNDKGIAPAEPKFYVTGDSALVTDAGAPGKAWDPSAIVSMEDTLVLKLKANVDYLLKVTLNGTWEGENNVKGYNELTEKTEGLNDVSKDHNIGFKLTEAGEVKVVYNDSTFKLIGNFYVEPMDTIPTTAPAAPTVAENNVMAIYCNHYTTNNANFAISGWAGTYQTLTIDSTKIAFWKDMTWECVIDPVNTDAAHDFSEYKKLHVDIWAPKAAQIKFTVEAVAGGNYKDGKVVSLAKGWNSFDFDLAEWPGKYDFKNVKCFVLEQYSIEHTPFAIANIYFYDKPQWAAIKFTEVVPKDSLAADASFILLGSDFKAQITDTDNKMEIDANACRFGSAEGYDMFTHRLKSGGKSSAKNFITLTIPEDGKLAIAVRTGSNSATDRNLVIKQGNDTLFNQLILESQAIKVMEDTVEVSVYPYVSIPVEAGNVVLSYPVGSLNFYAFAFKPEPIPVYYMKNNWNEGQWLWREMTRNGLSYKLDSVVYGGNGVNYNTAESDEGATWVPDSMILGDEIAAKDTVSFVLNPIAKTVTANLVGKYVKPADQLSCAEIYALADSAAVLMNGVVVTYVNGSNIFVKDETGAMLIYLPKNTSVAWKPGDILSNVRGIKVTYKGLVEVSPTQAQVAAVEAIEGYVPAPEELTFVNDSVDMNKYIIVKGIEFDADTAFVEGKNGTIKINLGNQAIDLFNKFKLGYEFKAGKKYDIVAIVSYYNALQLYFVSAEAQVTTAYYLAGSMNGWTANEAYMFTANPANEGEYMLTTALAVNDEFKVIGVEGTTTTWYPDGMGNNYKVDDAHAGEAKTIYFRPEGGQEGWYAGYFFVEENELVKPTTAPAAPTAAEDDVLAIYCDQYKTNNLHFGISGWAGAYEVLDIDSTKIGYWTAMTWECIIDPVNTDAAHDLSGYKKLHVDLWAPKSAQIQVTVEAVAGGNYKDGQLVDLVQGWNSVDFVVADWKDGYDFKNVKCFVFEKYNIEGKPFAFANIYFYDKEAQGIENTNDNIKAIKRIENGMIIIEKNGKKYTITGQLVK